MDPMVAPIPKQSPPLGPLGLTARPVPKQHPPAAPERFGAFPPERVRKPGAARALAEVCEDRGGR